MSSQSVAARLVTFMRERFDGGVPDRVRHEALRLLINQLKGSVGATNHPAVRILHEWATNDSSSPDPGAHVVWFGTRTRPEQAAFVNGALFEVLDFNDTYIPCFMHAVSGVLPAVLAGAECTQRRGDAVLDALALGIEIELACATILLPTAYYRGFVPGGITGAIGGAAACSLLYGLDETATRHAIGHAMNMGVGTYQSAGYSTLPYIMATAARNGLVACELAGRGLDAATAAFEGDKGMLSSYSDERPEKIEDVLNSLGQTWRIFGQSYKTVPTETITHAPIECALAIRKRAGLRTVKRMRFGVTEIVVKIADERRARFGVPTSELTAKFDLRHCVAAAWERGKFTVREMKESAYTDPRILDLRSRIDLIADSSFPTFDGCSLEVEFTDGSTESIRIDNFLGTPGNPMSDDQLSAVFRSAAAHVLTPQHAERILAEAWSLPAAENINTLMSALRLAGTSASTERN